MKIFCCACKFDVEAVLTSGKEIYPNRPDLSDLPFWKCPSCGNFVGCHHKTKTPTLPLGVIPSPEIRKARGHIHKILDPLWKTGRVTRRSLYAGLSKHFNKDYHTAEIRSIEEAREVWKYLRKLELDLPW